MIDVHEKTYGGLAFICIRCLSIYQCGWPESIPSMSSRRFYFPSALSR
jgi:hypothetical protein